MITQQTPECNYQKIFVKKARSVSRPNVQKTDKEWARKGVKILKRKILGCFRQETYKSLDELCTIIQSLQLTKNDEETKQLVNSLDRKAFYYGNTSGGYDEEIPLCILFKKSSNSRSKKGYKINSGHLVARAKHLGFQTFEWEN